LFFEGDEAERVFVIEQGGMKSYKSMADGRCQIISFAFGGDLLGWISSAGRYTSSVEALTSTVLLTLSRAELDKLRRVNHSIEAELAGLTATELKKAQEHILLLGRKTAAERLACFIAELVKRGALAGSGDALIELPMSQEEIADYLGLRPETVNRVLSRLRQQGVVKYESHRARSITCSLGRLVDVDSTVPI
jgi:CRP-like cAMP-binding protein